MIRNRAEAMSCGGCHQNSNDAEIAPNVHWPKSGSFVHVDEKGALSPALTEQFLPARAALLKDYLQETIGKSVEKWRFAESNLNKSWYSHCQWVRLRLQDLSYPTLQLSHWL
jgi:hypothetical protein